MNITYELSQALITAALKSATEQGERIAVAVLDAGGHLVAFGRMDGAPLITIDTAVGKAHTAAFMNVDSSVLHAVTQPGQPLAGFQAMTLHPHPLVPFAGGVVLQKDDTIIGAVGISGARTSDTDEKIAKNVVTSVLKA